MNIFKHRTSVDKTEKVVAPPSSEKQQKSAVEKIINLEYKDNYDSRTAFIASLDCTLDEFINTNYKFVISSEDYDDCIDTRDSDELEEGSDYEFYKPSGAFNNYEVRNNSTSCVYLALSCSYGSNSWPYGVNITSDSINLMFNTSDCGGNKYNNIVSLKKNNKVSIDVVVYADDPDLYFIIHPLGINLKSF